VINLWSTSLNGSFMLSTALIPSVIILYSASHLGCYAVLLGKKAWLFRPTNTKSSNFALCWISYPDTEISNSYPLCLTAKFVIPEKHKSSSCVSMVYWCFYEYCCLTIRADANSDDCRMMRKAIRMALTDLVQMKPQCIVWSEGAYTLYGCRLLVNSSIRNVQCK
jgi:hypothetical protein